jgi:hypothetical protein
VSLRCYRTEKRPTLSRPIKPRHQRASLAQIAFHFGSSSWATATPGRAPYRGPARLLNQSRTRQAAGWRTTAAAAAATRRLAFQLDVARSFSNSLASVAGTTVFLFPCLVQLQASTRVADRGHDSRDSKRDSPLPPPAAPLPFGLGPRRSLPSGVRRPPVASGCLDSLCTRSRRSGQLPAWDRPPRRRSPAASVGSSSPRLFPPAAALRFRSPAPAGPRPRPCSLYSVYISMCHYSAIP